MTTHEHEEAVQQVMESILRHNRLHFSETLGLTIEESPPANGDIDELRLRSLTALISVGGPVSVLTAFSFDIELAQYLLETETQGLGISDEERPQYQMDTLAETLNVVLGHSTADLAQRGNAVVLSAPVVLEDGGKMRRPKGAYFTRVTLSTAHGVLDVNFITPKHLFGDKLQALKN